MASILAKPIVLLYKEVDTGKAVTVRYYELTNGAIEQTPFTELIKISKDRGYNKSKATHWLHFRHGKKWSNVISGLFKTSKVMMYRGDYDKKKNLIVLHFSNDWKALRVFYFTDFYKNDIRGFLKHFL